MLVNFKDGSWNISYENKKVEKKKKSKARENTYLLVEVLRALDIFGLGFTSLVTSPMDGDDGGVACTAVTTGKVVVAPRRPVLLGLRGVGVVDMARTGTALAIQR